MWDGGVGSGMWRGDCRVLSSSFLAEADSIRVGQVSRGLEDMFQSVSRVFLGCF